MTTKKIPVSFSTSFASEYLNAVKGTSKGPVPKGHTHAPPKPPPAPARIEPKPTINSNDSNSDSEYFYVRRNKFGCTKQFLRALKPVVIIGRFFGVVARADVLDREKKTTATYISQIITSCLSVFLLVNAILMLRLNIIQFQKDTTTFIRPEGFCHSCHAWIMFLIYIYQLFASYRFRNIVQNFIKANEWSYLSNHEGPVNNWFSHYPHACAVIIVSYMVLGVTENILYDVQRLDLFSEPVVTTSYWNRVVVKTATLEKYYKQTFPHWHDVMPSSVPALTFIFVLLIKLCAWGWVYADTIPMVLCRALWEKLRAMDQSLATDLFALARTNKGDSTDEVFVSGRNARQLPNSKLLSRNLDDYQKEYLVITELAKQVHTYIFPLVLGNYVVNMYLIIVTLFYWIGPFAQKNQEPEQSSWYAIFALLHFSYRLGILTYFVAEVYQMSMSIKGKIQTVPNDLYTLAVDRLERTLVGNPTAILLFGAIRVTRQYFLAIIAIIFVAQIILLQIYTGYNPLPQQTNVRYYGY